MTVFNIVHSVYLFFYVIWTDMSENKLFVITSLAKEVMFSVALVSLSVCLFVCLWTTLLKKL